MSMGYKEVKEWLDKMIMIRTAAKIYEKLNNEVEAIIVSGSDGIHIYKGIEAVSKVMGVYLDSRERSDGETEYFFNYCGHEFFQLGSSGKVM